MRSRILVGTIVIVAIASIAALKAPDIAAGGLLYPSRRVDIPPPPQNCVEDHRNAGGIPVAGWRCAADGSRRGTIVYLHGIADNRASSAGTIKRYRSAGYDVIAYDSRRHGHSGGDVCTYGFHEKKDVHDLIDTISSGPVILLGTSLGAAIALQAAAEDPRVSMVIGAEVFSDLRTVAVERAPWLLPQMAIDRAFAIAEARGEFVVDQVSPVSAAKRLTIPVLLIHGADDVDTPPAHSRRVFDALRGRKRLVIVQGAGHNQSLNGAEAWRAIDEWIDTIRRADQ
jgi:pimeloyl-ACP methyl ester carboxylesterase